MERYKFVAVKAPTVTVERRPVISTLLLLVGLAAIGVILWAATGGLKQYFEDKAVKDQQEAIRQQAEEATAEQPPEGAGGLDPEQELVPLESQVLDSFLFVRASAVLGGQAQEPRWFMVDSGSSFSALGKDYANALGVQPSGHTQEQAGSATRVGTTTGVGFALHSSDPNTLPLEVTEQQVIILNDRKVFESIPGARQKIGLEHYGGILGMPFLHEYNLTIDYNGGQIHATKQSLGSLMPGGISVPLKVQTNVATGGKAKVLIKVYVGSEAGGPYETSPPLWILDLGSNESVIAIKATENLNRSHKFSPIRFNGPTKTVELVGGPVQIGSADVGLAIGETAGAHQRSLRKLTVAVPMSVIDGIQGYGGDLGGDYLKTLGVIGLALKEEKLYL